MTAPPPPTTSPIRIPAFCGIHAALARDYDRLAMGGLLIVPGATAAAAASLCVQLIGEAEGLRVCAPPALTDWEVTLLQAELMAKGPLCCRLGTLRFKAVLLLVALSPRLPTLTET